MKAFAEKAFSASGASAGARAEDPSFTVPALIVSELSVWLVVKVSVPGAAFREAAVRSRA